MVRLKMRADSMKLPSVFAFRKPGMSMCDGALVLAGRQAVGVVVAEDQLEVGLADLAQARRLRLHLHARLRLARAGDGRRRLALHLHHAHAAGTEARAASARSRGWAPRCRCRGRPPGGSGPARPVRVRPSISRLKAGVTFGRCGVCVVSRRSTAASGAVSILAGSVSVMASAFPRGAPRVGSSQQGHQCVTGAAGSSRGLGRARRHGGVELAAEVSHPGQRAG